MKKRPIPTEKYPTLLWYQEKRVPCTDEERDSLFNRYFIPVFTVLKKDNPNASGSIINRPNCGYYSS